MGGSSTTLNTLYVGDSNTTGIVIGKSDSKVAFFGGTPVVQQTAATAVATTVLVTTTTGGYCFTTTSQPAALIDAVNAIITALSNLGIAV